MLQITFVTNFLFQTGLSLDFNVPKTSFYEEDYLMRKKWVKFLGKNGTDKKDDDILSFL